MPVAVRDWDLTPASRLPPPESSLNGRFPEGAVIRNTSLYAPTPAAKDIAEENSASGHGIGGVARSKHVNFLPGRWRSD